MPKENVVFEETGKGQAAFDAESHCRQEVLRYTGECVR